jgi:hypothetical protein
MKDWYWLVAWAIAVGGFAYILPRAPNLWRQVFAVILVTLLGLGAVVLLYAAVFMLA